MRKPKDPDDTAEMTPELKAAIAALNNVQAEISRIETLKKKLTEQATAGGVKGNRAKAELSALESAGKILK